MVRKNPLTERGPTPANGRGHVDKHYKNPNRDCRGCPSSREKTQIGEEIHESQTTNYKEFKPDKG